MPNPRPSDPLREHYDPGDRFVPVDRRWLGLDRATLIPAAVVLVFAFVMAAVLPMVDESVDYDDPVAAGDVMELQGGVTFAPAVGWGVTSGVRRGSVPVSGMVPRSATVEDGDTSFTVTTGRFDGDARALLEQIRHTTAALDDSVHIDAAPSPITTDSGEQGVVARYAGPQFAGTLAAFVVDGRGIQVVAKGPPDMPHETAVEVARMIASIGQGEAVER